MEIVNLSSCAWRLLFATSDGRDVAPRTVGPGETLTVTLAAGDYTVTQTALSGLAADQATRRFPLSLAAGETYRWPLATLLTAAPPP